MAISVLQTKKPRHRDKTIGPTSHRQKVEEPGFMSQQSGSRGTMACAPGACAGSAHLSSCRQIYPTSSPSSAAGGSCLKPTCVPLDDTVSFRVLGSMSQQFSLGAARAASENAVLCSRLRSCSSWGSSHSSGHIFVSSPAWLPACLPARLCLHPHGGNAEEQGPSCLPLFAPFLQISWKLLFICPQFSPA